MGKFIFIPALVGQIKNMYLKGEFWKNKPINSFSHGCIDYYPYLLASAWWEMEDGHFHIRNMLDTPPDLQFYGDSGGYQAGRKGIEIDIPNTVQWQMDNCDYAMSFDHPPSSTRVNGKSVPTKDSLYDQRTNKTYENNIRALQLIDLSKVKYYNVMQGETLPRRDRWYNMMKDLPFHYMSVATKPAGDPLLQAFAICHLHSKGYTGKVHVLGVGGNNVLPIFPYMKDQFEEITVDSSSYGQGVRTREYLVSMKRSVMLGSTKSDHAAKDFKAASKSEGLKCKCPTCSLITREEADVLWSPGSIGGALITMHNLWMVIGAVEVLNDIRSKSNLKNYKEFIQEAVLKGNHRDRLSLALEFMQEYFINGIENTYLKYIKALNIDSKRVITQENLF